MPEKVYRYKRNRSKNPYSFAGVGRPRDIVDRSDPFINDSGGVEQRDLYQNACVPISVKNSAAEHI